MRSYSAHQGSLCTKVLLKERVSKKRDKIKRFPDKIIKRFQLAVIAQKLRKTVNLNKSGLFFDFIPWVFLFSFKT